MSAPPEVDGVNVVTVCHLRAQEDKGGVKLI
jgi:hypothetical protein